MEYEENNNVNPQLQYNGDNDVIRDASSPKNFSELQQAIDDEQDNVLDLDCNYICAGSGDVNPIEIAKDNFTIDGHGYTIGGTQTYSIIGVAIGL